MVHFSEEMPQRVDSGGNVAGRRFVALDGAGARGQTVQHPLDPEIVDEEIRARLRSFMTRVTLPSGGSTMRDDRLVPTTRVP